MGVAEVLANLGAEPAGLRLFDRDDPSLLPYATVLSTRGTGDEDMSAILGVYEWQDTPLVLLVDGNAVAGDREKLRRIRRLAALRGDAPYLGVVFPGRLEAYEVALDGEAIDQAAVNLGSATNRATSTFARLGNLRPVSKRTKGAWITKVVLHLLDEALGILISCDVLGEDAISLAGRALFLRFLGDRGLLPKELHPKAADGTLLDGAQAAREAFRWLDDTFNGDFLPLVPDTLERLPQKGFDVLGNISRKAPGGQLFLGWNNSWDDLHFAHIPVGVLSQAYERHLAQYDRKGQQSRGGFYTPRGIADTLVRGAFAPLAAQGQAAGARLLDPAAGAGVFLIMGFQRLVMERWRHNGTRPDTQTLREILYGQVTGLDVDEKALRFAALGLYLVSIELDPNPMPVEKLSFARPLRGNVLHLVGLENNEPGSHPGSLDPTLDAIQSHSFDVVIGNPPWSRGTGIVDWAGVSRLVGGIARRRLEVASGVSLLPNKVLDLAFLWRAMEWAKPGAQIAFALHARLLFQQGDGMPTARNTLFAALDVVAVLNGTELRQTKVWPEVSAPFCLLFARNQLPGPASVFRFLSPRLERHLNDAGTMRIDPGRAVLVTPDMFTQRSDVLKILFRGGKEDLRLVERLRTSALVTFESYWTRHFGSRMRNSGNGYQRIRDTSRIRKNGDGMPGSPATYLHDLPEITPLSLSRVLIDAAGLAPFARERIHDPRARSLFDGPLLIVHETPWARRQRIAVGVCQTDVVFNQSFYGYSAASGPGGERLLRFLSLIIGSRPALWLSLISSGKFGVERDTIEKTTIDQIMVPDFDLISDEEKDRADHLFERLVEANDEQGWARVDDWVACLYGLHAADLGVIEETLRFNLPFAANRNAAQAPPSPAVVGAFLGTLETELRPWGMRKGQDVDVVSTSPEIVEPWRGLQVRIRPSGTAPPAATSTSRPPMARVADQLAASEIILRDEAATCLWVERLDQARFWSEAHARSLAREIIWNHVDMLTARRRH